MKQQQFDEGHTQLTFADTLLQACFELKLIDQAGHVPAELQRVGALIATHDWFRMLEGPHSARVHETIERLLSPGLRSGLRDWYRRPALHLEAAAAQFRDHLSRMAGERLEHGEDLPLNAV